MDIASRAAPDGYTLLLNTAGGQTLAPIIYKTKFDGLTSWEPIGMMSTIPFVIVAREGFPAKDWAGFVKLAKAGSPPVTASSGSSLIVLMTDQLKRVIGAPTMINAQYKGTSLQAQAVIKGEVDVSIDSMVTLPHIKDGRVKALAVIAPERVDSLPNVPTLRELGVNSMEFSSWSALLAPKGTPAPIVAKLSKELQEISKLPDVQQKLKAYDHKPVIGGTPQQLTKQIKDDMVRWRYVVRETGFKIQE
jgi:tripartite-type tricarboxylate transporter receptor subunit TctC